MPRSAHTKKSLAKEQKGISTAQVKRAIKKAGVAQISGDAMEYYQNQFVDEVLHELARLTVLYADYCQVKTIASKHVREAHRAMTGRTMMSLEK